MKRWLQKTHFRNKLSQKMCCSGFIRLWTVSHIRHNKQCRFREAEGGLARPRVKFKGPGMQRSCPEEPGRQRAKKSSTSCVLRVPSIKLKKLTSAADCEECTPANKRKQSPGARSQVDPGECEKCEKDQVHHWAQVWNIHGFLTSSWPLGFATWMNE